MLLDEIVAGLSLRVARGFCTGDLLVGKKVCLRRLTMDDLEYLFRWENDPTVWRFGNYSEGPPYSREVLREFIDNQQFDIYTTGQQRFVICLWGDGVGRPVGFIDLFDFDEVERRAGIGVLICEEEDRLKGYASDALDLLCEYAGRELGLREVYCSVEAGNLPSLKLFRGRDFEVVNCIPERSGGAFSWVPKENRSIICLKRSLFYEKFRGVYFR